MPALALDAATERVAVNLLRHLEWQAEGFSLVFLFADVGPALQLADWLDQRLILQGRPLQREEAGEDFSREPEAAVDRLLAEIAQMSAEPGAVWLGMHRHPSDARWNMARRLFLARLNERRYLLERDLARPLVLVFPAGFRAEARHIAPDLWHVRVVSHELRVVADVQGAREDDVERRASTGTSGVLGDTPLAAFAEWQRVQAMAEGATVFLPTAWAATGELLQAGRPGDAEQLAASALSLARQRVASEPAPTQLRDLSVSLNNVGRVAQAQGDWAQAESVYRESLALRRQLLERLGGTPEALRDLTVSLDNVGRVAQAQGDWAQAESVYRESLALRRQLLERLGGTPEALRDLSVSLDNVGRVAQAQGDWAQAESVYRESLALSRQLLERLGGTPEALDDLAVSLLNVSRVPPGDPAARTEALHIYESLSARFPDVKRYTDLMVALRSDNPGPPPTDPAETP